MFDTGGLCIKTKVKHVYVHFSVLFKFDRQPYSFRCFGGCDAHEKELLKIDKLYLLVLVYILQILCLINYCNGFQTFENFMLKSC